jgi:hypothetical protein
MFNKKKPRRPLVLKDGDRVVVAGGGPAGAFFAIHLLRMARKGQRDISVTIIDRRARVTTDGGLQEAKDCNFCAGVISPRLQEELVRYDIILPPEVICETFTHIWIHGLWKNFPLKVPAGQKVVSVFRGALPPKREGGIQGFDAFILQAAVALGARIITGEVLDIQQSPGKKPYLSVRPASGNGFTIEADFVCLATGLQPNPAKPANNHSLFTSYQKINPGFVLPKSRPSLIFELKLGRPYLEKYLNREFYIIVSGSKALNLDHIALIPKGEYLTVAMTGNSIDRARKPEVGQEVLGTLLSLPHIRTILPRIAPGHAPIACMCAPRITVAPARAPYSDRIALAGDAMGARLYRDGLYSAFVGARALARTVLYNGIDRKSLSLGYGWVSRWLAVDNRYGSLVIGLLQAALKTPFLSRLLYQSFATEMKFKEMDRWPLGDVLWKLGSGAGDYRDVFTGLFRWPVIQSILTGLFKTIRNVFTEALFGLNWEACGRYPTVVIKEKRGYIKESISRQLGITLDPSPEMERMYAIKIRAPAADIFKELGRFGDPRSRFLRLRFIDVSRISGFPNRQGAVIRYRLRTLPAPAMDVRLVLSLPEKALLYEPAEIFATRGKLIFDITPTTDGNNRLVVYTAFDFKTGRGGLGRLFWKLFKLAFPGFAHDVVWNHALCTIKAAAEKNISEIAQPS